MSQNTAQLGLDEQHLTEIVEEHQQFSDLTEKERQQLLEYVNAVRDIEQAQVDLEQAKGWRAVFERSPPETIPFIIYCIYVSAYAIGAIVAVSQTIEFYLLFGAMILPLFALPKSSFRGTYTWLRETIGNV